MKRENMKTSDHSSEIKGTTPIFWVSLRMVGYLESENIVNVCYFEDEDVFSV